jgi:glycosyltransferase involved in cell wall biosynthesis
VIARPPILQVLQPDDGGVAEHVLRLTLGLHRSGWPVEVAAAPTSVIAPLLEEAGVPVHTLELRRAPGREDLGAALGLRRLDARRSFGLVHAHSSKAGALTRIALGRRRRMVYTPHCFAFAAPVGRAPRAVYRGVEQALLPLCAAVIAVCDWERRLAELCLRGARDRVHVIPNGVADAAGADADSGLTEFADGEPLAGLVSVLRVQKDPLLAVRAAARLSREGGFRGRLAVVGQGPLRPEVEHEIQRLELGDRVAWFPFDGDVRRYLAALDAFVLPSAWEALPLSVLEAMSCALPVVATAVGGVPEAVQDRETGRLVPPGDEAALADAMREVLGDAHLGEGLGAAGRRRFEECFGLERMVDATADLYSRLLRDQPGSRLG